MLYYSKNLELAPPLGNQMGLDRGSAIDNAPKLDPYYLVI